jgi:hypothetical protein
MVRECGAGCIHNFATEGLDARELCDKDNINQWSRVFP